jgi:hypothetical protein
MTFDGKTHSIMDEFLCRRGVMVSDEDTSAVNASEGGWRIVQS